MGKKSSQRLNDVSASEGVQNQIVQDFEEISSVADFCGRVRDTLLDVLLFKQMLVKGSLSARIYMSSLKKTITVEQDT
ncbi:unnamed protein product [Brassica rapa]|uniref:Uncharacterized protein n=2 Tax=Brassica TaxID=3705 RepID=A0A8D9H6F3_BRACM|nr:unnamed protein product [Brassica napus]CAG7893909.1 unnamed protein product [Brassica rapa]